MPYILPSEVRTRVKLLSTSDIDDPGINNFIIDAESYINLCLSSLYVTPVQTKANLVGTVSIALSSTSLIGTNTTFLNDIQPKNHLRIGNQLALVQSVNSDTSITISEFITSPLTNANYFIIPEEICSVSRYFASKLLLDFWYSERAYNQNADASSKKYEDVSMRILDQIEKGKYYNGNLKPQVIANTSARGIIVSQSNTELDIKKSIEMYSSWWT